ncbi:hypothetical protein EDB87DRAFT_166050 [Lactarius vividus]|nr:hypothetical protein EDB87DRAFT_166050 [Lactarius vividus]
MTLMPRTCQFTQSPLQESTTIRHSRTRMASGFLPNALLLTRYAEMPSVGSCEMMAQEAHRGKVLVLVLNVIDRTRCRWNALRHLKYLHPIISALPFRSVGLHESLSWYKSTSGMTTSLTYSSAPRSASFLGPPLRVTIMETRSGRYSPCGHFYPSNQAIFIAQDISADIELVWTRACPISKSAAQRREVGTHPHCVTPHQEDATTGSSLPPSCLKRTAWLV